MGSVRELHPIPQAPPSICHTLANTQYWSLFANEHPESEHHKNQAWVGAAWNPRVCDALLRARPEILPPHPEPRGRKGAALQAWCPTASVHSTPPPTSTSSPASPTHSAPLLSLAPAKVLDPPRLLHNLRRLMEAAAPSGQRPEGCSGRGQIGVGGGGGWVLKMTLQRAEERAGTSLGRSRCQVGRPRQGQGGRQGQRQASRPPQPRQQAPGDTAAGGVHQAGRHDRNTPRGTKQHPAPADKLTDNHTHAGQLQQTVNNNPTGPQPDRNPCLHRPTPPGAQAS